MLSFDELRYSVESVHYPETTELFNGMSKPSITLYHVGNGKYVSKDGKHMVDQRNYTLVKEDENGNKKVYGLNLFPGR